MDNNDPVPMIFEDEHSRYYEGVVDGVRVRYAENKSDTEKFPKKLIGLLISKYKEMPQRNPIEEHISLCEEWLSEGKFFDSAEVAFAQSMRAVIDSYRKRKQSNESRDP